MSVKSGVSAEEGGSTISDVVRFERRYFETEALEGRFGDMWESV